jgi:hypothetical protein
MGHRKLRRRLQVYSAKKDRERRPFTQAGVNVERSVCFTNQPLDDI